MHSGHALHPGGTETGHGVTAAEPSANPPQSSLTRQVRVGLACMVALCVLTTGGVLSSTALQSHREMVRTLQVERSRAAAAELNAYLEDLQRKLGYLARVPGLAELGDDVQLRLLEGLARHNRAYEVLATLDPDGKVKARRSSGADAELGEQALALAFRHAFKRGEDYVGPVELGGTRRFPTFVLAVPIRDRQDRVRGALVARVNLRFLWHYVARVGVGRTGYAYVLDNRNLLIAGREHWPPELRLADLSGSTVVQHIRVGSGPTRARAYRGLLGSQVVGAASPIHSASWDVVVELPTREAYAPIRRMLGLMGSALVAALLLAMMISGLFSRWVVGPLRELTGAAMRIRSGDLGARVDVVSHNELGLLASTFNSMAAQIRGLFGNLQETIADLRHAEQKAAFLARASASLTESLDYQDTLRHVPPVVVGALADWCVLDVVDDERQIRRAAWAHAEDTKAALLTQVLQDNPPSWGSSQPQVAVLKTGQHRLITDVAEDVLRTLVRHDDDTATLRELGTRSVLIVPLLLRERITGALTLVSRLPERYRPSDLPLAEELAYRVALAVDNANLYRKAQEAIRARETFIAVAGHELRTPLTPLLLSLQNLLRGVRKGPVPREALLRQLEQAQRQTVKLNTLVDSLLDVTRITSGRLELHREEFDLADLATELVAQLQGELERARCPVRLHAAPGATGHWDRVRVGQVLTNLLTNACKFGGGKPVDVEVTATPTRARLTVRDQGIGIAPQDQVHLFAPFARAVSARHYGGLGLGLYVLKQIVDAHGGTVTVESAPGLGTAFTVELPRFPSGDTPTA
ncbi:MAG: ATP-binding protein [Myxococcota bacterium]